MLFSWSAFTNLLSIHLQKVISSKNQIVKYFYRNHYQYDYYNKSMYIYENIPCIPANILNKINTTALNLTIAFCDSTSNSTRTGILYDVQYHNSRQDFSSRCSSKSFNIYIFYNFIILSKLFY